MLDFVHKVSNYCNVCRIAMADDFNQIEYFKC